MNYHFLGNSDLRVSEFSFGCMSLGNDQTSNEQLLHLAYDQGITLFDTADLYDKGQNEISVGKALKDRRSRACIATKVGNQWRTDGSGWDWNPRKAYILQAADASLKRLQTDYIDLYQLHGGTLEDPMDETIEAFEYLKETGKIRQYGISSIRPTVIREYVNRSTIVSVMMQYSLLDRRPEESVLPLLQKNNISVLTRGSLAKGLLVNKTPADYLTHPATHVQKAAEAIRQLATAPRTATGIALRFVLHSPAVATAVVGIRTLEQLHALHQAQHTPGLTDDEFQQLAHAVLSAYYEEHRI